MYLGTYISSRYKEQLSFKREHSNITNRVQPATQDFIHLYSPSSISTLLISHSLKIQSRIVRAPCTVYDNYCYYATALSADVPLQQFIRLKISEEHA